jgi:hypothetical protein
VEEWMKSKLGGGGIKTVVELVGVKDNNCTANYRRRRIENNKINV